MKISIKILYIIVYLLPHVSFSNDTNASSLFDKIKEKNAQIQNEKKGIVTFENLLVREGIIYEKFSIEPFTGIAVEFHTNGQLFHKMNIKNGEIISQKWKCYYDNGKLYVTSPINKVKIPNYNSFTLKSIELCIISGRYIIINGEQKYFYKEGNLKSETYYLNGVINKTKFYNPDGKLQKEETWKNGKVVEEKIYQKKVKQILEEEKTKTVEPITKKNNKILEEIKEKIKKSTIPKKSVPIDIMKKISDHISKCWTPKPNSKVYEDIEIRFSVDKDMSIKNVKIENKEFHMNDEAYMALANQAKLSVIFCSPLPINNKYHHSLKNVVLNFSKDTWSNY